MRLTFSNWSNGLWTAGPPSKAPANTLTRMTNMWTAEEGTVSTRGGVTQTIALANSVDGAYVANQNFFKLSSGAVYKDTTSLGYTQSGRFLQVTSMMPFGLGDDIVFFPDKGCTNQLSKMRKYYNGVLRTWGIAGFPPPAPSVTLGDPGSGPLIGNYTYRVAPFASATQTLGTASQASTQVTATANEYGTGQKIILTGLDYGGYDPQVDYVYIYRTQGGIPDAWYYVTKVAVGTSSYTDDRTADMVLGDGLNLDTQGTWSPTYYLCSNVAARHQNRILIVGPQAVPKTGLSPSSTKGVGGSRYVYPSLPSQPELFYIDVYEIVMDAGDTPQACISVGDYAVIFGNQSIYSFQVDGANNTYTNKIISGRGTPSGRTVCLGNAGVYFYSDDGIYVLSGLSATKISASVDAVFRGISRGGLSTIYDPTLCSGTFAGGRYYFTYYGADGTWHTLIFNETLQRWKHYTGWVYTFSPVTGTYPRVGLANTPFTVGQHTMTGSTDAGTAFQSICGFNIPTGADTMLVDIREFRIAANCSGPLTVTFYDEGGVGGYSTAFSSLSYDSGWVKHSLPASSSYYLQPEVVFSSLYPFTLRQFEVLLYPVRKYEEDYTRVPDSVRSS